MSPSPAVAMVPVIRERLLSMTGTEASLSRSAAGLSVITSNRTRAGRTTRPPRIVAV